VKYAIVDIETTGGLGRGERITEIAIVLHDGSQVLDTFTTLLNPEQRIPWNITVLTGITDAMVANAPRFFEVAKQIVTITEGAIFVAHNVSFDYYFIREEFARLGYSYTRPQLCTVRLSRKVFPGLPSYSLSNLKQHFRIYSERSHRALDDTLATVNIFERILATKEASEHIEVFVNQGIKESKLPRNISLARLREAPEACGIYYLYDEAGTVIYVGKSLNIRKRLHDHFADHTAKGEKMREGVADFSVEVTGSELVALLFESAEIKRIQPRINKAQRIKKFDGAIFTYLDERGYRCFAYGKNTIANAKKMTFLADYAKLDHARNHLQAAAHQNELCQRLCSLDFSTNACFMYALKKCNGACIGAEPVADYNARAEVVMARFQKGLSDSFFLVEPGRTHDEWAVVGVRDGVYQGYGYLDRHGTEAELEACLNRPFNDPEAGRIIYGYMEKKVGLKKINWL
jgi:DNA polymerase III subunit epsilon